jgi:hypothetical protein
MALTNHPHLVPRLRKEESYTSTSPLGLYTSQLIKVCSSTQWSCESSTLSNPIFLPLAYPQLLFVLGGKEVGGLLVIILQF